MRRAALSFALLTILALMPAFAQDRGLAVIAREAAGQADFDAGRQVAVIIGIDRYKEWPSLRSAVSEAKAVREVLADRYYIDEFIELYDEAANAGAIRRLFAQELPAKLGIRDSLLVFYAGHGYLDASKTGFWIASDGAKDEFDQGGWIPNAQLRNYVANLKAQRILVLADSCFSGDFLNVHRGGAPVVDSAYYRKALQLTARQVLTSGASESVPDESEFGSQLVNLLKRNTERLLDPYAMYDRIKLGMTRTLPLLGSLPGNETGASFVLFLKDRPEGEPGAAISAAPAAATPAAVGDAAPVADLVVAVDREGAEIWVDGKMLGHAPNLFAGLGAGRELLVEARAGDYSARARLTLKAGELRELYLLLELGKGNLFFQVANASAYRLVLDGLEVGELGTGLAKDLDAGVHQAELVAEGMYWKGRVEVKTGATSILKASPYEVGSVAFKLPADAAFALKRIQPDGAQAQALAFEGRGPRRLGQVPVGAYSVEIGGPGYESLTLAIALSKAETKIIEPWTGGTLTVTTDPPGARVSIDGIVRGAAPLTLRDVAPGIAIVGASMKGYEEARERKPIELGKSTTLALSLKRDPAAAQSLLASDYFVFVRGGAFIMGSNEGDPDERPVHEARLSDFYLGKREVTQSLYQSVMGGNPSYFKGEELPVEQVSWHDAVAFCNALSDREGLRRAYTISDAKVSMDASANGYRLPTETEWEYAAGGGSSGRTRALKYSGANDADYVAWYGANAEKKTHDAGTKAPNELGLHDMSGNVREWCWDWYGGYPTGLQADPPGASSGEKRVTRGGNFLGAASEARSTDRGNSDPGGRAVHIGFRLARRP